MRQPTGFLKSFQCCNSKRHVLMLFIISVLVLLLGHREGINFVVGEGEGYRVKTLAGVLEHSYDISLTGTSAKHTYLQSPCGICLGVDDGDMYVSDCGRHLIFRIFSNGSMVVVGGMGFSGWNNDGYVAKQTLFNTPSSIGIAPNGNLFVADTNNDKIRIISSSTGLVSSISHSFNKPLGVVVSSNNIVYIADTGNNFIKKYDISTGIVSIIGGGGYLDGSNDNLDAKLLLLNAPTNIHVVSSGTSDTVYFTDSERLKSIDSKGMYRIVDTTLSKFYGVYISASNEIWTSSSNSHVVQKKIIGDSQTTIIGGQDLPGYYGDDLVDSYSEVRFYGPTSLVVKNSIVYLADTSNNCIRKIDTINKIVTTFSGGIINHGYGEDIPPLETNPVSSFTYPFYYKSELYFVENYVILRKVSNGVVKTLLGSASPLKTPISPTRRYFPVIYSLFSFGNGEVIIATPDGTFILNVDTLQLTFFSPIVANSITGYGTSVSNGTLFFADSNYNKLYTVSNGSAFNTTNLPVYITSITCINSTTLYAISANQLVKFDLTEPSNFELVSNPIQSSLVSIFYNDKLYITDNSRIYEMRLNDSSFQHVAGLSGYNVSGVNVVFFGVYNGENPALQSPLQIGSGITVQNGIILAPNVNGVINLISNGKTQTLVGRTPMTVPKFIGAFSRDEDGKVIYMLDNRVLKKYNETSGITTSLSQCLTTFLPQYALQIDPPPFFYYVLVRQQVSIAFSKFDRMIYILDSCRIIQIDPITLNIIKIAGSGCGAVSVNVPALESPIPVSSPYGFTVDANNGDLYFATYDTMHRFEKSTGMIRLLFTNGPIRDSISPDGTVTNATFIGSYTYFRVMNDDIYFSTDRFIRVFEKQSNGDYYLRTLVGNGEIGYSGDNLPALQSSLNYVNTFFVKQNGDIILADSSNFLVRKYVKKTGILKNLAGTPNQNIGYYTGDLKGTDTSFISLMKSISVNEKTDDIYLLDTRLIRKLSITCEGMSTFNANNNTCSCLSGYYGDKCQPHSCNGTLSTDILTCSGKGNCTDFDVCVCKDGYIGKYCQVSTITNAEATLIVAIVVPIVGCLLLTVLFSIVIIVIVCCVVKKKRISHQKDDIATIDSKNIELFEFPSNRSIVMSSSLGSSLGSENEDAFSRYANIVRIGQGAFGSVYKVTDTKQGHKIKAVKLIQFQSFTDLNSVMKEASQLSHIKHPNILKVNDYFVTNDNLLCIDMEYYEKGDLTIFYKADCPEETVKQILKQMCAALTYVHSQLSIIHRDIKPSNIFIKSISNDLKNIEIVLADFGLAKKHQEMNGQSYVGTPIYMSPEIALGSTYSYNTDIFSLGVSIYQIMTKDTTTSISGLLMGNQNAQTILTQQMKQANVQYSDELIQLVLQMLERNQQTRPNASDILLLPYLK